MSNLYLPEGYTPVLNIFDTQRAIKTVKDTFERVLAQALNLQRVTAPVIVRADSGINDDLNGVERKVDFTMKNVGGSAEVCSRLQSGREWRLNAMIFIRARVFIQT